MYRGRLAPSPTGLAHLGVARTSLVAWLRARSQGGQLVMRIEDLDGPRVVPGATEAMLRDLHWLGLDWDEGPYFQSQRFADYQRAVEQLRTQGIVYPCTCSRKEIQAIASAPHADDTEARYPGTCRNGVSHTDGRTPSWRFRMPDREPDFVDVLHGAHSGRSASDFVIKRADGVYAYQLAVVVDDIAMNITEVVRGDDLLTSTPRQIALYRGLGAAPPDFLHVPLMLGPDGVRLAKRHGAIAIAQLRDEGYAPERIIGFLAHTLGLLDHDQPISPPELISTLDVTLINKSPTRTTLHADLNAEKNRGA
jgi:glutamyl-tRNA synthetase